MALAEEQGPKRKEAPRKREASKLAPSGRAGVRALKGPGKRFRRREAPIGCGFARTYESGKSNGLSALCPGPDESRYRPRVRHEQSAIRPAPVPELTARVMVHWPVGRRAPQP